MHWRSVNLHNEDELSVGAGVLVILGGILSMPGYAAFAMLLFLRALALIFGNYPRWEFIRNFNVLGGWALVIHFFGQLAHPLSLVIACVASFLPIGGCGKVLVWKVVAGGFVAWLIVGRMLQN